MEIQLQLMVRVAIVCWLAEQVRIALVQPSVESYNIIRGPFFGISRLEQLPHAVQSYSLGISFHKPDSTRLELLWERGTGEVPSVATPFILTV